MILYFDTYFSILEFFFIELSPKHSKIAGADASRSYTVYDFPGA